MSLRWQFERGGVFNVTFKVEIYDSEYSGSAITLDKIGKNPLDIQLGTPGADPLDKIRGSFLTVRLFGETGDYEDLHTRDNERFLVKLYIDGTFEADFIPIPDTFTDYVTDGQYTNEIKCANLSLFKQKQADDVVSDGSRLQAIQDIINVYFSMTVEDGTVYYPTEANTGGSSLVQQNIQASRLEDMTCYEALEFLIPKGMQYRVTRGKVIIVPVTEASFTAYTSGGSSTLYDDNFQSCKIGGRLSKTRKRLRTYDGVRRTYNPLDADNIVPSGEFEVEDFGLSDTEEQTLEDDGEVKATPIGWSAVRGNFGNEDPDAVLNSDGTAWRIYESIGSFSDQSALEAGGTVTHEQYRASAGQVLAGNRLKIEFTYSYESVNRVAHVPIKIKVGDQILFRGRDINGNLIAGAPEWRSESAGLSRHVDHVLLSLVEGTGYGTWEYLTPPIPATGEVTVEIETPSVDRSYEPRPGENFLDIAEFRIDPADKNGDILTEIDTLAGEEGDVYEYTEGFGDGFSSFNPGALFNIGGQVSFTPKAENLTTLWVYDGNDNNIPGTELPLSELETKYLSSQLTIDRDRLNGTVDTYDFLALIDGYRVNYIQTDFRHGESKIELVEIRDHDLTATIEDRKKRRDDGPISIRNPQPPDFTAGLTAIGITTEDYEDEPIENLGAELDQPIRVGIEYWVINENELSRENRFDGVYPVMPEATDSAGNRVSQDTEGAILEYGPGLLDGDTSGRVPIQEQVINAPKGSFIYRSPGQTEIEDNILKERLDQANEDLDTLNNEKLPALQDQLDQLNDVELPALQDQLDELNDVKIPDLDSRLVTLDGYIDDPSTIPNDYNFFTGIVTNQAFIDEFVANDGYIGNLVTKTTWTDTITANNAYMEKIVASTGFFDEFIANSGFIDDLIANNLWADKITANEIAANTITANEIFAGTITANEIDIDNLFAQQITLGSAGAGSGYIQSDGFTPGSDGFRIEHSGDAEFNSVVVRDGNIISGSFENLKYKTTYETPPGPASFDNYAISNRGVLFIAPTGGTITITGIQSLNDGSYIPISNRGDSNLVLTDQDGSSNSSNRIITPSGGNETIPPGGGCTLIYDGNSNRWRFVSLT